MTKNVAFARGYAWERSVDDPFASFLGTFMVGANPSGSVFRRLVGGAAKDES